MKRMMACFLLTLVAIGADIPLNRPALQGGRSLMESLSLRKSARNFAPTPLPTEMLSGLLWAANGINRMDGHRTAPTGLNVQDISVYVILEQGIYRYSADHNMLVLVRAGDFRQAAGKQDFVRKAPVNLVYVQELGRAMKGDAVTQARHGGIHTGAIMQNVYLYCAANGLITVARDYIDRNELSQALGLSAQQSIMLTQSVGFPTDGAVAAAPAKRAAVSVAVAAPAKPAPATNNTNQQYISPEAAQKIALKAANIPSNVAGSLFVKVQFKQKYGRIYYEVEFKYNGMEYEYKIDAKEGRILEAERERD